MTKRKSTHMKIKILLGTAVFVFSTVARTVYADELVISGNGADSTSEISATSSQETNVAQSNDANISNDVNADANTGNNQVNDNVGDGAITTGDILSTESITNDLNASKVSDTCCPTQGRNAQISGNGPDSQNTVLITSTFTNNVNVTNNANVANLINGIANSGNNTANGNFGNVSIKTGAITVSDLIRNHANNAQVSVPVGLADGYELAVKGNGSESNNTVNVEFDNETDVAVTNTATLLSQIFWDANTGNNDASDNVGEVSIETGDIVFNTTIENDVNKSIVDIDCCKEKKPGEEKPPVVIPPPPPSGNGRGDNGGNGNGDGGGGDGKSDGKSDGKGGSVLGSTLPTTGSGLLLLAFIGNIIMLFFGMFLRLRSGRSPSFSFAL